MNTIAIFVIPIAIALLAGTIVVSFNPIPVYAQNNPEKKKYQWCYEDHGTGLTCNTSNAECKRNQSEDAFATSDCFKRASVF